MTCAPPTSYHRLYPPLPGSCAHVHGLHASRVRVDDRLLRVGVHGHQGASQFCPTLLACRFEVLQLVLVLHQGGLAVGDLLLLIENLRLELVHIRPETSNDLLDVFGRVARFVLEKADEEGEDREEGLWIQKLPSQQQMANRLGTSRETVSRALSEFHKRGWLESQDKGVLVRPELDHNYRF